MKSLFLAAAVVANPILFVTQVPVPADFTTVASVFGNQTAPVASAPRGGDLWIRYPDGTLKNLTHAAGFGAAGMQSAGAIAVREPSVHWSGTKALFSMAIGAPPQQYLWEDYVWQIYEITGLGETDTPVIRKIPNQPAAYNNVSPIYGTDDRILFTSDRPRSGEAHLYPQLDEYEEAPTVTGLWSLDPVTGDLRMLNHTPSGLFSPSIDSFGRLIFTRWDHLQRDQQADTDATEGGTYGTFDYADESANAARGQGVETFPEPRSSRTDLLAGTNLQGISINHFFPRASAATAASRSSSLPGADARIRTRSRTCCSYTRTPLIPASTSPSTRQSSRRTDPDRSSASARTLRCRRTRSWSRTSRRAPHAMCPTGRLLQTLQGTIAIRSRSRTERCWPYTRASCAATATTGRAPRRYRATPSASARSCRRTASMSPARC